MSIEVHQLEKHFGHFKAVDNVSFTVANGEFVTLLGPSGSGKSTILRCIAGLELAGSGHIKIDGEDVTTVPVQKRQVGFVFQHYALFKHMTVRDNVAFGLKVRSWEKADYQKRSDELLALVGLEGYGNRLPSQLSGGQRQRVALARALAPAPKLLLLDEPFGALDTRLRKDLRAWLRELHNRINLTTLLVTHDQDEAFELSDRVVVVNYGKIEQDATPTEVFNKPATEFVARFVGESNRIDGPVTDGVFHWGNLRVTRLNGHENAQNVILLFRPMDVYLSSQPEPESVPGVIMGSQFMGALQELSIDVKGPHPIVAHLPKSIGLESQFNVGKAIYLRISAAHVYGG